MAAATICLQKPDAIIPAASSEPWEDAMRAQLATWFDDADWTDETPAMTVSVGSNGLCQLDGVATVGLPPDAVFSIVCDPHNRRVFKNIKSVKNERVISDCNGVKELEMDMVFAFQLPFFTGTFDAHMRMVHDRPNRRMTFAMTRPGLMRKFEGHWQVEPLLVPASAARSADSTSAPLSPLSDAFLPGSSCDSDSDWASASSSPDRNVTATPEADLAARTAEIAPGVRVASRVVLHQVVQPSVAPPAILKRCIHTILHMATKDVLAVFQREAAIIRSARGEIKAGGAEIKGSAVANAAGSSLTSRVWGLLSTKA